MDRLEEKGSAPNTLGQTRSLGLRYRDEAVKYLRAAQSIPEEMTSDVFLSACMMISHADVNDRCSERASADYGAIIVTRREPLLEGGLEACACFSQIPRRM